MHVDPQSQHDLSPWFVGPCCQRNQHFASMSQPWRAATSTATDLPFFSFTADLFLKPLLSPPSTTVPALNHCPRPPPPISCWGIVFLLSAVTGKCTFWCEVFENGRTVLMIFGLVLFLLCFRHPIVGFLAVP